MAFPGIETVGTSISEILSYPTTGDYYFYAKILAGIWVILTFILYRKEEDRLGRGDIVSSMGVSAIATIFLSVIGSLFGIIQNDVNIQIIVGGLVFIILWLFKKY